jgi:hypothetical protein
MNRIRLIWLVMGFTVAVAISYMRSSPPPGSFDDITQTINQMAADGVRIDLGTQAWTRMGQRRMTNENIRTILAEGQVTQPPHVDDKGEEVYRVEMRDAKGARLDAVDVIPQEESLFIVSLPGDGPE